MGDKRSERNTKIKEYIIKHKLSIAKALVVTASLSIIEIALSAVLLVLYVNKRCPNARLDIGLWVLFGLLLGLSIIIAVLVIFMLIIRKDYKIKHPKASEYDKYKGSTTNNERQDIKDLVSNIKDLVSIGHIKNSFNNSVNKGLPFVSIVAIVAIFATIVLVAFIGATNPKKIEVVFPSRYYLYTYNQASPNTTFDSADHVKEYLRTTTPKPEDYNIPDGYEFCDWCECDANGRVKQVIENVESYDPPQGEVYYRARFKSIEPLKLHLKLYAADDDIINTEYYVYYEDTKLYNIQGQEVTHIDPCEKTGYTFNGFYTIDKKQIFDMNGNLVKSGTAIPLELYAKYTVKTYKLKFNANGGALTGGTSFSGADITIEYGETFSKLGSAVAESAKYLNNIRTFLGWSWKQNEKSTKIFNEQGNLVDKNKKFNEIDFNGFDFDTDTLYLYALWGDEQLNICGDTIIGVHEQAKKRITQISLESLHFIRHIADKAFDGCTELTTFYANKELETIGSYAFRECKKLKNVRINNCLQVSSLGIGAFSACPQLTSISLPALANIEDEAFKSSGLITIDLPYTLRSIGSYAFSECEKLEDVRIENHTQLESIGEGTFSGCVGLKAITLPNTLESIGEGIFKGCKNLEELTMPYLGISKTGKKGLCNFFESGLTGYSLKTLTISDAGDLDNWSLFNIDCIQEVNIQNCTSIGYAAFGDCANLQTVTILGGAELEIGSSAFAGCNLLSEIYIADTTYSIGTWAFCNCSNLRSFDFTDCRFIGAYAFAGCTNLGKGQDESKLIFEACLNEIGAFAFQDCTAIKTIIISERKSVLSIGNFAFDRCVNLERCEYTGNSKSFSDYIQYGSWWLPLHNNGYITIACADKDIDAASVYPH